MCGSLHPSGGPGRARRPAGRLGGVRGRWLAWPAVLAMLAGCAGFVPQPGPGAEPPGRYVDLTLPVVALGDTQEHEPTGVPLHDNDSAVDAFIEVAQRPPEQPLFGRRVMEWVLRRHPGEPFVHLGDVMDLSCRSESDRVLRILREASSPGAVLPGNHDGLMFGIYGYNILSAVLDTDARHWNQACRRGAAPDDTRRRGPREALSKRDFIALLLSEQARRLPAEAGLRPPPADDDTEHRLSWRNPDPQAFLSAVEARLMPGLRYADSFLAQQLLLPAAPGAPRRVRVIGLDTNQAGPLVGTLDTLRGLSPGSQGHVRLDQVQAVTPWVDEAVRRGDIVVFAGHHPWQSLGLPSRLLLRGLMGRLPHPLVYLSAHTHRGFWAVHRALARQPLLELNVSSLSDWPIAYRRIRFAWDEQGQRLMLRGELWPRDGGLAARVSDGGAVAGGARADGGADTDAALLDAWSRQVCARIGPEPDAFVRFDREMVVRQRQARGSVLEWVVSAFAPACPTCEAPLVRHAQQYQDVLLDTIVQTAAHLGQHAHRLYEVPLPAFCGDGDFIDCARSLQGRRPQGLAEERALFRQKAQLVDRLAAHLDELRHPQAEAYMTCRAVHAARLDFELTDDDRNNHRGEHKRRQEQFFRVEASVGMD